jgi:lipopolysaccharide assembly protein A
MRVLVWLFRVFIFFTLFAFALNNQQEVALHWFFGFAWQAPMVMVVLAAFAAGCAVGVLAMVPSWWRQRRAARLAAPATTMQRVSEPSTDPPSQLGVEAALPPRDAF